jgi:hypothetical protein
VVLVAEVEECRESMGRGHDDVATMAAIAAVRASTRHKHLPPETADAVASSSGSDRDVSFIDKHMVTSYCEWFSDEDEKVYPTLSQTGGENSSCPGSAQRK